jgi:hypothetical protein
VIPGCLKWTSPCCSPCTSLPALPCSHLHLLTFWRTIPTRVRQVFVVRCVETVLNPGSHPRDWRAAARSWPVHVNVSAFLPADFGPKHAKSIKESASLPDRPVPSAGAPPLTPPTVSRTVTPTPTTDRASPERVNQEVKASASRGRRLVEKASAPRSISRSKTPSRSRSSSRGIVPADMWEPCKCGTVFVL